MAAKVKSQIIYNKLKALFTTVELQLNRDAEMYESKKTKKNLCLREVIWGGEVSGGGPVSANLKRLHAAGKTTGALRSTLLDSGERG